ncbi:MAG: hypothetical protein COW63_03950 [Bacteroidetes bacterium CG18_big_fil_WC_8_21_14_2_50_41_14]|nr:MAG: hypothetical protein COW63_03950 [Bacteroidetes bacterium CG18_big_fil_WC_8_21_14_2_50_41_14]
MNLKNIGLRISGTIFSIVSVLHLLRVVSDVSVTIGDWQLPLWVSMMGFLATGFLSGGLWWLSCSKNE